MGRRHMLGLLLYVEVLGLWGLAAISIAAPHIFAGVLILNVAEACLGLTILRRAQSRTSGSLVVWLCACNGPRVLLTLGRGVPAPTFCIHHCWRAHGPV